jgi:hypothetical protein
MEQYGKTGTIKWRDQKASRMKFPCTGAGCCAIAAHGNVSVTATAAASVLSTLDTHANRQVNAPA